MNCLPDVVRELEAEEKAAEAAKAAANPPSEK
jgi:hypothetical protein